MSGARITISLTQRERSALMKLAEAELRSDREQARYLLREALAHRGLLAANAESRNGELQVGVAR